jgi:hypothetical protein
MTDDHERRAAERAHDELNEFGKQNNDAAIKTGEVAIRSVILANGGAVVAVLAFLGNLASRPTVSAEQLTQAAGSLIWFAAGVAAGLCSLLSAYLTNLYYANLAFSRRRTWEHPYSADGPQTKRYSLMSSFFHLSSFVTGAASLILFMLGILYMQKSLVSVVANPPTPTPTVQTTVQPPPAVKDK